METEGLQVTFVRGDKYSSKRTCGRVWALAAGSAAHPGVQRRPHGRSVLRWRRGILPSLYVPFFSSHSYVWREEGHRSKWQGTRRQGCTVDGGRLRCGNRYSGRSQVRESLFEARIRSTRGRLFQSREAKPHPCPQP